MSTSTAMTKQVVGLVAVLFVAATALASAALFSLPAQAASPVSQGYVTEDFELAEGMAVALVPGSTQNRQAVERASISNQERFVGIVTTLDASLLTLTHEEATVYVTTGGEVNAYMSDINGDVKEGDFVVISPLKGILMKAHSDDTAILGVAQADFTRDNAQTQTIVNNDGSQQTAAINKVQIELSPRVIQAEKESFLVSFGNALTGKPVTALQVLAAMSIFLLLIIIEGAIIHGAVHSTLISIGRNPLAKATLYKQLAQVIFIACVVLAFGLGSIYIILWI